MSQELSGAVSSDAECQHHLLCLYTSTSQPRGNDQDDCGPCFQKPEQGVCMWLTGKQEYFAK